MCDLQQAAETENSINNDIMRKINSTSCHDGGKKKKCQFPCHMNQTHDPR